MTKGSVYEGKTFDEAVQKGLSTLGLNRSEASITIVEEGKGGFLGFGARPYRVSISRRPGGAIREPDEHAGGGRGERSGRGGRERGRGRDEGRRGERRPEGARAESGRTEGARREARRDEPRRERAQPARAQEGAREESRRDGRREGRRSERREERPAEVRASEPRPAAPRREDAREERREAAESALPPAAAAVPRAEAGEDADAADRKRRRRRGRRGGRGRRKPEESASTGNGGVAAPPMAPADEEYDDMIDEAPETMETGASFVEQQPVTPPPPPAMIHEERHEPDERPATPPAAYVSTHEERPGPGHEPAGDERTPVLNEQELAATSKRLTEDLLKAMGFEGTVSVQVQDTRADVTAEVGRDDDLLTGRKGEVRQALQHLLNRYLNRGEGSRYHLQLEINDFWQRRETELEEMARAMADTAANERKEVVSEYLNSQERRIIHVTLKEDARVRTYALGTGMIKRVAVAPADFPERTEDESA